MAIVYPNLYLLGMSNLGYQGLFYMFLKSGYFHVNRFFYEGDKVYSPENDFPLNKANMIFVSQSYELDFLNLIKLLIISGIEPFANNREKIFIGVGGAFANINPTVFLSTADIVFKGDFEHYIDDIMYSCSLWQRYKSKDAFVSSFASLDNYMAHSGKEEHTIRPKSDKEILFKPNYTHILTDKTSFSNTFLIEITRGCRFNCSFCTVPGLYGKLSYFPKEVLFELISKGLTKTNKVGLVSALTTDHKDLIDIISFINNKGAVVGFSSLRIENITDELLGLIRANKQNTLTIAPEVASKKLGRKIRKNIKRERILSLSEGAIKLGFKNIKLYFIIGFAQEDEGDINDIISLVLDIRKIALSFAKAFKYMTNIIVNVNQFIPKPKTPFSSEPFIEEKIIRQRVALLKKRLLPVGSITIRTSSYKEGYIQWKLSHANEKLSNSIISGIKNGKQTSMLFKKEHSKI